MLSHFHLEGKIQLQSHQERKQPAVSRLNSWHGGGAVPGLYRCPKDAKQWTLKPTSLHKVGVTEKVGEGFNKR